MDERVALVTGAAGDLGTAVATRLARRGVTIVLADLDTAALERARLAVKAPATIQRLDVTDEVSVANTVSDVLNCYGRLDVLFNNAGIAGGSYLIAQQPLEDFKRTIEVNVMGVFLMLKHALPAIARQGAGWVVNTSSTAGQRANARRGAYGASKAAVIQLSRAAALEHGQDGIRVNALCPGPIDGRMIRRSDRSMAGVPQSRPEFDVRAAGRVGQPQEVADVAVFLLLDAPAYMTGSVVTIDGCAF